MLVPVSIGVVRGAIIGEVNNYFEKEPCKLDENIDQIYYQVMELFQSLKKRIE